MRIREKERMRPILFEMFSYVKRVNSNTVVSDWWSHT